mmetsp:Transcript_742/g.1073  ORF Transcript_742/g.1073 Transcript_742/m.1073 type:complete len:120 (-) Transcript_742:379-738(-)
MIVMSVPPRAYERQRATAVGLEIEAKRGKRWQLTLLRCLLRQEVDLLESYGGIGSVSLICERGHYLREARFCLQKHFNNTAGERMLPCPGTVLSEDNCMDEIFIAKFDLDIMKETHSSV